jgi:hypothetical protein
VFVYPFYEQEELPNFLLTLDFDSVEGIDKFIKLFLFTKQQQIPIDFANEVDFLNVNLPFKRNEVERQIHFLPNLLLRLKVRKNFIIYNITNSPSTDLPLPSTGSRDFALPSRKVKTKRMQRREKLGNVYPFKALGIDDLSVADM